MKCLILYLFNEGKRIKANPNRFYTCLYFLSFFLTLFDFYVKDALTHST